MSETAQAYWNAAMREAFRYRVHDHTGDDLGFVEHPAPNLEAGDVIVLPDGREALITARVEGTARGLVTAMLEVALADPKSSAATKG